MQKVLVFGMGNLYQEKEEYIRDHYQIVGYLDNKVIEGDVTYKYDNLPVYHPNDIDQYADPETLIILMSMQYVEMWQQLCRLGIDGKRILFGVMFPPFNESEEVLFENGRHLAIDQQDVVFYFETKEKCIIKTKKDIKEIAHKLLREKYRTEYPLINAISQMPLKPASRKFGMERGKPIDRYYIEDFLEKNKVFIRGDCMEIAENTYTMQYGGERVKNSHILHIEGWGENAIKGNLATGEGIEEDKYDCVIITQTFMFIFDIEKAAQNVYRMLKKNGTALITVSGISQISRYDASNWGSYYSFHEDAMRLLFEPIFNKENVQVYTYGNVKTAIALLYGLCCEDLKKEDFELVDKDYPVIISVVLKKA